MSASAIENRKNDRRRTSAGMGMPTKDMSLMKEKEQAGRRLKKLIKESTRPYLGRITKYKAK
jgi:hypothetical protein